jgi:dihydrofolate synthase/folylpolyglutamate synthase
VAGTNGKGSTSHLTASILQEAGYKVGLYTSPHLQSFTERIRINGAEVSQEFVINFVERCKEMVEKISPSFFEITVAMAFDYFAQEKVDIAVIEVGLGGRLDSTNIITPEISIVTNISFDHKDLLGDTLAKIAVEKAGIIKKNVPVIISKNQSEIKQIFLQKAKDMDAPIVFAEDNFRVEMTENDEFRVYKNDVLWIQNLDVPLKGYYQSSNFAGVLQIFVLLNEKNIYKVSHENIINGFKNVISNTHLKGRWQKLAENPLMICDVGHNEDGWAFLSKQIAAQNYDKLFMVIGAVNDKDLAAMFSFMPQNAKYFFCKPNVPRGLSATILAEKAKEFNLFGDVYPSVVEAIEAAQAEAQKEDFIFIGGSTFVVAEVPNL